MNNFWKTLPKPFLMLAPMDGVTDNVFREIVARVCKPDVLVTEFTGVEGLDSKSRKRLLVKLRYSEKQRPILAQIWGLSPKAYFNAAKTVEELGFDGIDINMGCPDHSIVKRGACSGLIRNQPLVREIIASIRSATNLPLSVKTRLGVNKIVTDEWFPFLLEQKLDAITVHGRIASQMSTGTNNWDEIAKVVKLRDQISPQTLIIGNGNVKSYSQALEVHEKYGVDGVMIGRGIFNNPWVFEKSLEPANHSRKEYVDILLAHMDLFDQTYGVNRHFQIMKKYFKMYIKGFRGANELRIKLMDVKSSNEARQLLG